MPLERCCPGEEMVIRRYQRGLMVKRRCKDNLIHRSYTAMAGDNYQLCISDADADDLLSAQ